MMTMLAMTGMQLMMALVLFLVCVLLMLIILVQKGRGGGLASAFGGGGGSGSAFGSKTGDVFTGITVALASVYLVLTVLGNYVFQPETGGPVATAVQPGSTVPAGTLPGAPVGAVPTQGPGAGQSVPANTANTAPTAPAANNTPPASAPIGSAPIGSGAPKNNTTDTGGTEGGS